MNFNFRSNLGFLLMLVSALVFGAVYESVMASFTSDTFWFRGDMGNWSSPNNILYSVVNIVVLVLLVRYVVEFVGLVQSRIAFIGKRRGFLIATLLFGVLQWWSAPIVHYVGFGGIYREAQGLYSWSGRWEGFGRSEFFGMVVASAFIIGMEYLRRLIVGTTIPGFRIKFPVIRQEETLGS